MEDPPKIVQRGYDLIAERYLAWGDLVEGDPRARYVGDFAQRLRRGAKVLDLGCGAGEPSTRFLAERFDVTGVDISSSQLRGAKQRLPKTSFIQADIARPMFRGAVFDGVVALYSISHIPRSEHDAVFRRIASWLKPGGIFLATLGAAQGPAWYGDWLGVPMFFSSFDADRNRELLRSAGFHLLVDEVVEMTEPEGPVSFLWVLARKPG